MGNKLKRQHQAVKAREAAIKAAYIESHRKNLPPARRAAKEVYLEYCQSGRKDRVFSTVSKQECLWQNPNGPRFGQRCVDEISVAEVTDHLKELYFDRNLFFMYVEGFLKIFYLIFGQSYSRNYLGVDTYKKLCVNKDTKIHMPKLKGEDTREIQSFNHEELTLLDEYFKETNAETAYMLGRCCDLRIGECYGLKWQNVDLEAGTILIDRQLQCENGVIKMIPSKTLNFKRIIYINDTLKEYLTTLSKQREKGSVLFKELWEQKQTLLEDLGGGTISFLDLVNTLPNSKIQTRNSIKLHSTTIRRRLGLNFKYHFLRHTFGTVVVELNTPPHLLQNQMGHSKIQVTQEYYLVIPKKVLIFFRGN